MSERLMAALDGARMVKYDPDGYLLAWFGGHGIHVYDPTGREVGYWMTEGASNDASPEEIEESMTARMLEAEPYPC